VYWEAADRKARAIVDDLRAARMNTAADLVERSVSETLTYYAFPDIHWQKIRTNNPLEQIMKEIRRRPRVVGAFPDGQSCLNLAAARLRLHCRHRVVRQVLHEHAAALSAAGRPHRSRGLIKCAKDSARYRTEQH
jgi:transposase-like protein